MNSVISVILILSITSTRQNLIRFGDFQNLAPSELAFKNILICDKFCNDIWYTTSRNQRIELRFNFSMKGQNNKTVVTDMIDYDYIQLCQDFNVVEIGIYQYTFDMYCRLVIKSCSLWAILNGQVINGSNHTSTDHLPYHNLGYMNITQQKNTICFQSVQVPFIIFVGSYIDNITVQLYAGKIPCNVQHCKFCVLNFPNICQVCQYMFELEGGSCQCPSKFYLDESTCKVCLFPCETCQRQTRKCLSCPNSYRLQQNQCVIADQLSLAASVIASMPGIEFFSIGKIFLGISNQFWPYYSHYRVYGNQIIEILTFFHTLQNNKWFLLSLDKKIDFNFQSLNFSDYTGYSNQHFLKMESKTSYFWDGAFEIVFFSFPTMLIVFFVLNKIFYLTFEYPISRYFRPYSFLLMIYFLGIGDDISYLSFLSFSNGMKLFSFKFQDKLGHIVWIFVFFLLVLFCSGAFFIAKILYKKLSKHFIDDFFPKLQSFNILSCLSMKAFVIGSVNALFVANYEAIIISLALIEVVFLIGVIYLQWKNRCYKIQTFMFLQMLKSIIMTIFNISLWIDWKIRQSQQAQTQQQTKKILDFNCKALIIVIIGLGALQAISTYFFGRETLNRKRQKQVPKTKKNKSYMLKITSIKQKAQVKEQISVKQQTRVQEDYFYAANSVEKPQKQNKREIRIKQPLKQKPNALSIIRQRDHQNEQFLEIIMINKWNDT